jgi:hypothetical protein
VRTRSEQLFHADLQILDISCYHCLCEGHFMQKWLTYLQNAVQCGLYPFAVLNKVLFKQLEQRLQFRWQHSSCLLPVASLDAIALVFAFTGSCARARAMH